MWEMFLECSQHESWIKFFLKTANQIVFLILFVGFMHRGLHGTRNRNSLWKSLTVVCCTLLANYCVWPLFLHVTEILFSDHNLWTLAILLLIIVWTSNRWFTSNEDQTPVPLQQYLPEQRAPDMCHSQGDVSERINPKSTHDIGHSGVGNLDPTETTPKVIQSHLQDDVSEQINSNISDETEYVDVESFYPTETASKGTQTNILPPTQDETNTPPTESIAESRSHVFFSVPQYKVTETSQQLASILSTDSNLTTLKTRSGRVYYANRK